MAVSFYPGDIPSKPGVYIYRDVFGTVNKGEYAAQLELLSGIMSNYPNVGLYPFSALGGDGKEAILDAIQQHL